MGSLIYKCINTRRCYWLCRGCLKGRDKCQPKCPDYLSIAKARPRGKYREVKH